MQLKARNSDMRARNSPSRDGREFCMIFGTKCFHTEWQNMDLGAVKNVLFREVCFLYNHAYLFPDMYYNIFISND